MEGAIPSPSNPWVFPPISKMGSPAHVAAAVRRREKEYLGAASSAKLDVFRKPNRTCFWQAPFSASGTTVKMHAISTLGSRSPGFDSWSPASGRCRFPPPSSGASLPHGFPIPPSVMAGILIAAMVYALLNYLLGLREWTVDAEEEPVYA